MEQAFYHFQLQPFPGGPDPKDQKITGSLIRTADAILIKYRLEGGLDSINLPAPALFPDRCHNLWQHTCFEFFVNISGEAGYREVNFTPNGCWNVYRFTAYRGGMQEEPAIQSLCCSFSEDNGEWIASCRLETSKIIPKKCTLVIGISVVLQHRTGGLCYWALLHPGLKADFHDRRCFSIEIPAVAG